MGTAVLVSLEQYMATSYRPDCDYIDGELQERNVGKFDHSNFQGVLIMYIGQRRRDWNVRVLPEQRLRVSSTRVRIPDVIITSNDVVVEQVITRPPIVCIEILSEDDTLRSTQPLLEDYERIGVQTIWVFDPQKRLAWIYASGKYRLSEASLSVPNSPIVINLQELYAELQ